MAQKRVVVANRAAIADDINDTSSYLLHDMEILNKYVYGVSKGVVTGLTHNAHTGLSLTINAGTVYNDGKFYERLTNQTITIPSTSGTYYIYCVYGTTNDQPREGYRLIDTQTREEIIETVNTRTYDSITLASTTTLGDTSSGELIGHAVVSGGVITSYTETRTMVTLNNIESNTLQNFTETDRATFERTGKITGQIIDDTDTDNVKGIILEIDNSHAGTGIEITTGTNTGAKGINIIANANTGYEANLTSTAIGFSSIGTSVNGTGFKGYDLNIGVDITGSAIGFNQVLGASEKGLNISGDYEASQYGAYFSNLINSIFINTVEKPVNSGANFVSILECLDNTSTMSNVAIQVKRNGKGQLIDWISGIAADVFVGQEITNNSFDNLGTGQVIKGVENRFLYGSKYSKVATGINITDTTINGINIDTIDDAATGINIANSKNSIVIAPLKASAIGINISGTGSSAFKGIKIANANYDSNSKAIDLKDCYYGIYAEDITGTGITLKNNATAIKVIKTANDTGNSIILDLGGFQQGISIEHAKTVGLRFEMNSYDKVTTGGDPLENLAANIQLSDDPSSLGMASHITVNSITGINSLPATNTHGNKPVIQLYNNTAISKFEIKFWDGSVWQTLEYQ